MKRRDLLKLSLASGGLVLATTQSQAAPACNCDGTPNKFIPKTPVDARQLENEF